MGSRVCAVVAALLMAIFGMPSAAAAVVPPTSAATADTYDDHPAYAVSTGAVSERGPLAMHDHSITVYAVAHGSHGASAHPAAPTTLPIITYDHPGLLVQLAAVATSTQVAGSGEVGAVSSFQRPSVAAKTVALDSSSARAYVTDTPVGAQLRAELAGCRLVMCSTAHQEWTSAMARLAGPNERALEARLSSRLSIVADNPSVRAAGLQLTRRVGENDRIIFGTADQMGVPIYTSDANFLRGATAQGVDFDAILHPPASPRGW